MSDSQTNENLQAENSELRRRVADLERELTTVREQLATFQPRRSAGGRRAGPGRVQRRLSGQRRVALLPGRG